MSLITIYFLRFSNGTMSVFRNVFILGRSKSKSGWYLHLISWFCRRIDWSFLEWSVMISAVYLQVVQGEKKRTHSQAHTQTWNKCSKFLTSIGSWWRAFGCLLCYSFNSFVCWKKCRLKNWERVVFFFNWQGYYKIKAQRTEHSIILWKKKKKNTWARGALQCIMGLKKPLANWVTDSSIQGRLKEVSVAGKHILESGL